MILNRIDLMIRHPILLALSLTVFAGWAPASAQAPLAEDARIVTLGSAITETVFALGFGDRVVAVDDASTFPDAVSELPQVGYYRTLSAEGLLSLRPDLVIGTAASGPPPALSVLKAAGVRLELVDDADRPQDIPATIERIAQVLGVPDRGAALADRVRSDFARVAEMRAEAGDAGSAVFVWTRGGTGLQVAGRETGAHAMMEYAGLENAAAALTGYQPLNAEALLLADPDVLIVPTATVDGLGGLDALLSAPGVATTTAAREGRIVLVDLLAFVGFGPRAGNALATLLEEADRTGPATARARHPRH
jgi:iron complex transport system substrate-binding protein